MKTMKMNDQRPKFLPSFIDAIRKESEERSWLAVLPYALACSAVVSAGVAYLVPDGFWANDRWDVSTAVYAGLLTFNGLVLALGWNAFARIYDVLLRGEFGKYVMRNNLLNDYLVHITFMHWFQIAAVLAAAVGLMSVLVEAIPLIVDRSILGVSLALTIYSIKQAAGAVTAMNDLVWQSAYFEANRPQGGSGNVVTMGDR